MAVYQLLFGSVEWPEPDERPKNRVIPAPERTEKLNVRLPRALKGYLEEAAEREGVSAETWAAQVLARSVRPNGASAH
jgi:predicted HicB family RNase H-like nuclease